MIDKKPLEESIQDLLSTTRPSVHIEQSFGKFDLPPISELPYSTFKIYTNYVALASAVKKDSAKEDVQALSNQTVALIDSLNDNVPAYSEQTKKLNLMEHTALILLWMVNSINTEEDKIKGYEQDLDKALDKLGK